MQIVNTQININNQITYFGGKWVEIAAIGLQGLVVDCNLAEVYLIPASILNQYKTDFNKYIIQGYVIDFAIVKNVNVSEAGVGKYNFTVDIDGYNWNQLGTPGITEPKNEWSISEQEDGRLQLTHTISARGISGEASLNLAKQFISGLAGLSGYDGGLSNVGINTPCLISSGLSENRINGQAQITEEYLLDPSGVQNGIVRYNVTCEDNLDNITTATINGEIFGCSPEIASGILTGFNFFEAASGCLGQCENAGMSLLTRNYTTDSIGKRISFSATLNTDETGVFIDSSIDITEESLTTVSIRGTIQSRGDLKPRWEMVSGAYGGLPMIFNFIPEDASEFPFNPYPLSFSETFNQFSAQIDFSATFNDREFPPEDFIKFNYSLNLTPPLRQYNAEALLNQEGKYYITDLGYIAKGFISIQGEGVVSTGISAKSKESFIKEFMENICLSNGTIGARDFTKKSENIRINESGRRIGFGQSWTFKGDEFKVIE